MNTFIAISGTVAGLIILLNVVFSFINGGPTTVFQQIYDLLSFGIGGGLILLSAIVINTKKEVQEDFYRPQGGADEGPPPPPSWAEDIIKSNEQKDWN